MTPFEITHGQRAGWQRRAAGELAAILDAHRDLPIITWTLASAGSSVVGQVSGPAPADQLRGVFDAWRVALMLSTHREVTVGDGTVFLRATTDRNRVRVTLSATLMPDEDGEGRL